MKRFNRFEYFSANILSSFPSSKRFLKRIYLNICFFLFHKKVKKNYFDFDMVGETFFGYYDSNPESRDFILFHETNFNTKKPPCSYDSIFIKVYDKREDKVIKQLTSKSFNWQQGSRLFWLDDTKFIYNDFIGKHVSVVYDVLTDERYVLDFPVQAISDDIFVSIDYNTLKHTRPDYGYFNILDEYSFSVDDVAFSLIDYHNNLKCSVSYSEIIDFIGLNVSGRVEVNHFVFSEDLLIFMFRWYVNGVRSDILLSYNTDNGLFKILLNNSMVSHYCLLPDNQVLVYANDSDHIPKYIILSSITSETLRSFDSPYGDGHPTYYKSNKVIIDTYPNRSGYQYLLTFDYITGNFEKLLTLNHSPSFFGESRCDLHPRYSSISNSVYFDSVTSGRRVFSYYELSSD